MMDTWNGTASFRSGPGKSEQEAKRLREQHAACRQQLEVALDVALEESFPASDPVSMTQPAPGSRDKDEC
jgi:hypothetical protein